MKRRTKKLKESVKFLVGGYWIDEQSYLHMSDEEYEKICKRRKKLVK